jgi:hypothetical protein
MILLLLDLINENPKEFGIFSAVALLLIRELRAISATILLKKKETSLESKLDNLIDMHKDPNSTCSTYGIREQLKEMKYKIEKILEKCQIH